MDFLKEIIVDTSALSLIEYSQIGFKILLSFIAGFALGLERKFRQQPIGVRTVILISLSSTLLMLLSLNLGKSVNADPARLAAQVVSGIGFLGGGAILRQGLNIKGLTSVATIWAASAIGLTIGAGTYMASIVVLIVLILALIILEKFETKYLDLVSSINSEEYYINMMRAWFFATALAKQYDQTLPYIKNYSLDKWTHNKTIQKANESFRITKDQKEELKKFRV